MNDSLADMFIRHNHDLGIHVRDALSADIDVHNAPTYLLFLFLASRVSM